MKQENLKLFLEKTPDSEKKQRSIHDKMMDYVDARYVADLLDEVCGLGHWRATTAQADYGQQGYASITTIEIYIDELETWVGKTDGGAQDAIINRDGNRVSPENDYKGALSDSFKRAAVMWGIGRDLYQPEKYADTINLDAPSKMPAATPHSGGVRTSEFPPTTQPTDTIESPLLSDDGQATQDELKRLVQKKNSAFPDWQSAEAKAFYFWMKDQGLDFGKYDSNTKTRYNFNVPTTAIAVIDDELDRLMQEPF